MNPHLRSLKIVVGRALLRRYSASSSSSSRGGGSKLLPTLVFVTGGTAAGLGAYYYYDPNAEVFKQARALVGVDNQPKPSPSKVAPHPPTTPLQKKQQSPEPKKTHVPPVNQSAVAVPPPPPPPQQQPAQKLVAPPKPSSVPTTTAATALPVAAAAAATSSAAGTADKIQKVESSSGDAVSKQVLVTALRAQQEALTEAHEAKIKVVEKEYERKLDNAKRVIEAERVVELRGKYEKASAALNAIEKGIEARSDQNARAKRLRALWAQVNALHARVNHPEYHGSTVSTIDKKSLKQAIEVPDKFVNQMLESLPNQPIHSLESLKQRFYDQLEPVAKHVSLIKEGEKFSLLKYACGKVLSWGVVEVKRDSIKPDKPISTTQVLDVARRCLDKGDLLSAAVAVNQLTGLPRQVASDWLADARALLETNQTLFALMTYAASNNVF